MRGMKWAPVIGAAMMLAACGGEKPAPAKEEAADALKPGLYELTSEVTGLSSTDKTTPATKAKEGDKMVVKACVAADGKPAPELFAEDAADKCEMKNSYIHYGRISAQMSCKRESKRGEVMPAMMGSFKADSFEGDITSLTYFIEDGDYRMTRKVSAKRVGDCPAGGTEAPVKAS
jgi:hypothetical protein